MKSPIEIINEANFEKDFHFVIVTDIEVVKSAITEYMCEKCGDTKYNPRNLHHCYKYGLLLFVCTPEDQDTINNFLYYATKEKQEEIVSGIVVFCSEQLNYIPKNFKIHNLCSASK